MKFIEAALSPSFKKYKEIDFEKICYISGNGTF